MYLQNGDHPTGLIRLLAIGLRVLTLLEFTVRHRLVAENEKLAGLYAGNPKRSTTRPTAKSILRGFKEIALTVSTVGKQIQRHLTPLSNLQRQILRLSEPWEVNSAG